MRGFREFATNKAPVDPKLFDLLREAKVMLEEPWEEEFYESMAKRVSDGWALSDKQRVLLEKLASGAIAEQRSRYNDARDNGDQDMLPSEAAAGMDDVTERFNQVRDDNLRRLSRDGYDHERGY
jgi:hypothetical protein